MKRGFYISNKKIKECIICNDEKYNKQQEDEPQDLHTNPKVTIKPCGKEIDVTSKYKQLHNIYDDILNIKEKVTIGSDQSKYDNLNKKMDNLNMNDNEYETVKNLVNMVFPKEITDTNK
ncbi:hypothetical protein PBILCG01_1335300 [Plasmodium sp. DRC-Itaito]|nr:hypothetical protein PBILCG01_1335300 [Plasmodium sp. DRC-Itaito]